MPSARLATILTLLAALLALGAAPAPAGPEPPADDRRDARREPPPQRVVIRVSRYETAHGTIELEDEDVLVVRTPRGELRTFAKSRLAQIVRLVEPKPEQPGVVVLRNGQQRAGTIIEDGFEFVIVEIEGVRARFRRDAVDYVRLEPTIDERYENFKATGAHTVPERHLALCEWLVDVRRYELAESELLDLIRRHELPQAERLLNVVRAQLALRAASKESDADGATSRPDGDDDDDTVRGKPRLISDADVNMVRVYEIDFHDPPKIAIHPDTIQRLIRDHAENPLLPASQTERARLFKAEPLEIVNLMFDLRARELYSEINVLSEPHALNLFRQRVHNSWLMNNCATSRCHGGPDAGRFFLERRNHKSARTRYTNLLTLERLEVDPARPLIDYQDAGNSLIIQYGLPREFARRPHPPARGWTPAFRRADDRLVIETVTWIESMFQPRPDYPVEFDPDPPASPGVEAPAAEPRTPR